jgi:hypothetical protein
MVLRGAKPGPQGLKPTFLAALSGTAEAVPYPKAIVETGCMHLLGITQVLRFAQDDKA